MAMDKRSEFLTKDLQEAGALLACNAKILRLEKESNYYLFVFDNKTLCEQLSNAFWAGELQVDAKTFSLALKTLKDRLFARR